MRITRTWFDGERIRTKEIPLEDFYMSEEVKGLPVAGYKPTQSAEAIAAVNKFKELEERTLRAMEALSTAGTAVDHDPRMLAIGKTQLQIAFMAINRAVFQPGRVALPED